MIQQYIAKNYSLCGKCAQVIKNSSSNTPVNPPVVTNPIQTDPPINQPTEAVKNYVYFRNSNWGVVKAYFWSDENKQMMSWPGNDMEKVADGVYGAQIPDGATMVIFTNGGDQTKDLQIPGVNMIFDGVDWTNYN